MDYNAFLTQHRLNESYIEHAQQWFIPILERLQKHQNSAKPRVIGLNGCQGSGKSTLADFVAQYASQEFGLNVVVLSIDDFYLTRSQRQHLAQTLHPLFATRGVPGTHDVALAQQVFEKLMAKQPVHIPRFDKANDDRYPMAQWSESTTPADIILFEGWCVGLPAQHSDLLDTPINALEQNEDPQGIWRKAVNHALNDYKSWFDYIDELWWLKAPSFDCVFAWRMEQELKLAKAKAGTGIMDQSQLKRFIEHYQRLTEHGLAILDQYCDVCWTLDDQRNISDMTDKKISKTL